MRTHSTTSWKTKIYIQLKTENLSKGTIVLFIVYLLIGFFIYLLLKYLLSIFYVSVYI